jgi:hypothetical protein
MAKMMAPNTSIFWVQPDATFQPFGTKSAAAFLTDLAAGKIINLSPAIAVGYTLNATDSDTDDSKTIVDEANSSSRGNGNYEAELPFYMEGDRVANPDSEFLVAYTLFKVKGQVGTLLKRFGYKYATPVAATQIFSAYAVRSRTPRTTAGDAGGPISFTVPFAPQGRMDLNKPFAA